MTTQSLAESMYLRLKTLWTGSPAARKTRRASRSVAGSEPFSAGRDPLSLDFILTDMSAGLGWESALAYASLVSDWPEIVGPETAANTHIDRFDDGTLVVRCASTAWATQLGFMSSDVLTKVLSSHPDAGLAKIVFVGPNAPSWKRGPRTIQGRGVRDTYG